MTQAVPPLPVAAIDAAVRGLDLNDERNGIGAREGLALRVAKVAEECGEASAALIGLRGQNPRKPRATEQDLVDELLDVALAALVAAASVTTSWATDFAPHVVARTSRVLRAVGDAAMKLDHSQRGHPGTGAAGDRARSGPDGGHPGAAEDGDRGPGAREAGGAPEPGGGAAAFPAAPSVMAMVREFHTALGDDLPDRPRFQDTATRRLRQELLAEEVGEAVAADEAGDLVGLAQELGDVAYVAYGTAARFGIPLDAVIAEIHRANMTKDAHPEGGKAVKGPKFRPADVAALIAAAGVVGQPGPDRPDRQVHDQQVHDQQVHDRQVHDRQVHDRQVHDQQVHDQSRRGQPR